MRLSSLQDHGHLGIMSDYLSESEATIGGLPRYMSKEWK